jgi:hypothetical protein
VRAQGEVPGARADVRSNIAQKKLFEIAIVHEREEDALVVWRRLGESILLWVVMGRGVNCGGLVFIVQLPHTKTELALHPTQAQGAEI